MHAPNGPPADPVRRSLDALEPIARERGVRIAIENGDFDGIAALLDLYAPDYLGLCCDVGHANMVNGGGIAALAALKHRLIAIHVHDNDGVGDLHNLPFSGTINWQRLAGVLAASAYTGPINMEVGIRNSGFEEETVFLAEAFERGTRLEAMRRGGEN